MGWISRLKLISSRARAAGLNENEIKTSEIALFIFKSSGRERGSSVVTTTGYLDSLFEFPASCAIQTKVIYGDSLANIPFTGILKTGGD